jgi:hypothetical protein
MLKPDVALPTALATAGGVVAIHQVMLPKNADIQALPSGVADISSARRRASWVSAGMVSIVSLIAKDPTIFFLGSMATVGMAFMTDAANFTESRAGETLRTTLDSGMAGLAGQGDLVPPGPVMEESTPMSAFSDSDFVR